MRASSLESWIRALTLSATASSAAAQTVYVDDTATGANNGSSWADAYVSLQAGLAAASPSRPVWVAEGIYRPAPPGGSTQIAFFVAQGEQMYGGFAGFETSIAQRDIGAHSTILSGDLLGNDTPGFGNRADNSREVVLVHDVNADTVLDGFVVEGADAPTYVIGRGGGVNVRGVSPLVQHCWIRGNRNAGYGGGAESTAGDPRFVACTFQENRATYDGGGLDLPFGGRVERCIFSRNVSTSGVGGGAFSFEVTQYYDCVFSGNSAGDTGAISAMAATGIISGCTIVGNTGSSNGGIDVNPLEISNCIVWGNSGQQITGSGSNVHHSTVQGYPGANGLDPRFADADGADGIVGTLDDDYRLLPGSPCIDSGDNAAAMPGALVDVAGVRRFSDDPDTLDTGSGSPPIVDRGAHEYRPCPPPASFCVTSPNTVGPGALMSSSGTAKLYADDLVLRADGCPPFTFGLFFHGSQQQQTPFGNGFRCVGGGVLRAGIVSANALGHAELAFDASAAPGVESGIQRHFQFWYRNTAAGGAGFNLSDGLTVRFCP